MDKELAKKVCRLVAGIIVSDDDLDAAEDAFIDRMLARFGIPGEERDSMVHMMRNLEIDPAPHFDHRALEELECALEHGRRVQQPRAAHELLKAAHRRGRAE